MARQFDSTKFREAKKTSLTEVYDKLLPFENIAVQLAPLDVDWHNVNFVLLPVGVPDLHNYFYQVISSFPNKANDAAGHRWLFNLWETNSKRMLGVLRISSDFLRLGPRDKHLGLPTGFEHCEQTTLQLKGVIPLPPFNYLAGGKLLTALAFSPDVQNNLRSKVPNLTGLSVCSIYGESIVYDRIPWLKFLGETKNGTGVYFGKAQSVPQEAIEKWWRPLFERRLAKGVPSVDESAFRISCKVDAPKSDVQPLSLV